MFRLNYLKSQPAIRAFTRIAGWLLFVFVLCSDFQRKSCSYLQGFALLEKLIAERLKIEGII